MGQLISQHVNKDQSREAINTIFPPHAYGYAGKENPVQNSKGQTSAKNATKPNLQPFHPVNNTHKKEAETTNTNNSRRGGGVVANKRNETTS